MAYALELAADELAAGCVLLESISHTLSNSHTAMLCLQSVSCWLAGAKYGVTHEWHFRSFLDHWDSAFGMMFALNFPVGVATSRATVV